jgi:hypothetical protein
MMVPPKYIRTTLVLLIHNTVSIGGDMSTTAKQNDSKRMGERTS